MLETALNHPNFAARMAVATYKETRWADRNKKVFHVAPNKVIEYILSGRERDTSDDQEIDLEITLKYYRPPRRLRPGTVGKTTLGRQPIHTAYWFIDGCIERNDLISPARHFIHEWLHVVGFFHWPNNSARGDVPYVVGDIVRRVLTEDLMNFQTQEDSEMAQLLDEAEHEVSGTEELSGHDENPVAGPGSQTAT